MAISVAVAIFLKVSFRTIANPFREEKSVSKYLYFTKVKSGRLKDYCLLIEKT